MSLSARRAALLLLFPLTSLLAEIGTLPPALAALRAKADAGDAIAQYNLGVAYAQGREISADPIEAYVWLSLAAEHGTPGKDYENLLQQITPAQLTEGKRRLGLRKNAVAVGPAPASPITLAPLDQPDRTADLTAKNQQLTAEVARLRAELDSANNSAGRAIVSAKSDASAIAELLNAKLAAATTQLNAAKAETAQAQAATKAADAAQAQFAQQKNTLAETVATLTAEKSALTTQLDQAKAAPKTDGAAPKIAALETQLANAKTELTTAKTELADAITRGTKASALETELARANQRTATLQNEITTLTADRATLRQQLSGNNRPKADDSAPQIAALNAQIASLTAAKSAAEQKLASAESRLAAPAAPAKNPELEDTKAKLEATLRSFTLAQNENAQLKSASEAAKTEAATLRQQLADAKSKLSPASAATPAKNEELIAANAKLETTLRSFTLAQNENAQLKSAAESAKSEAAALRQQLTDAQNKIAAAASSATASTADPVALEKQLKDTETKLNVALRSYVVISQENDKLKSEVNARTDSSSQAIAAAEARAATAAAAQTSQLAAVRDQLRQVQAQSAAYADENFQLRTRLASGGNSAAAPTRTSDRVTITPVPASAPVATPPAASPAPATVVTARTHIIAAGDTLRALSKKYYGDPTRWNDILTANNDVLAGKPTLPLGRTIRIP